MAKRLAQGVPRVTKELVGHRFIDHRDERRLQRVVPVEIAAGDERRLHGGEESGADQIGPDDRILRDFGDIPVDVDDLVRVTSADRGDIGEARGPDAGNRGETPLQFLIQRQAAVGRNTRVARVDTDQKNLILIEACIERGELGEGLEHESGADQQDQRKRYLRRDQHLSEAEPGVRFHYAARIGLHGRVGIDARTLPGGRESEKNSGDDGDQRGEGEHAGVNGKIENDVRVAGGEEVNEHPACPLRKQDTQHRAHRGKKDAFRKQLPNQAGATRADRHPDGNFLLGERRRGR